MNKFLAKLKMVSGLKVLLGVSVVTLAVLGGFAYSYRQTENGMLDESGYMVTSSDIVSNLTKGSGATDGTIVLSSVATNDMLYQRAGKYYVGADMIEYEYAFPMYTNDGNSLYFLNDSATLITEEFEQLTTYAGMFIRYGTSFNPDHDQADIETIYLVKLSNGLYMNALPITLSKDNSSYVMGNNSIISMTDSYLRFYEMKDGGLVYQSVEDVTDLVLTINGQSYAYEDFLDLLSSASGGSTKRVSATGVDTPDSEAQEEAAESAEQSKVDITYASRDEDAEGEEENGGENGDMSADSGSSTAFGEGMEIAGDDTKNTADPSDKNSSPVQGEGADKDSENSNTQESTLTTAEDANAAGNSGDDSADVIAETAADAGASETAGESSVVSSTTSEQVYVKPGIKITNIVMGTYSMTFDIAIDDAGSNLKKLTLYAEWTSEDGTTRATRKSTRTDGPFTLSNLQSGQDIHFSVDMKYRQGDGTYVEEEDVFTTDVRTLSIEEGTNTLYLSYTPDAYDPQTQTGGYSQIYSNYIEVHNLKVEEDIPEGGTSTMNYVRTFRVDVYDDADESKSPTQFTLSNSEKSQVTKNTEGYNWRSSTSVAELPSNHTYYYEFELLDRFGDSLNVVYVDHIDSRDRDTTMYEERTDDSSDWKLLKAAKAGRIAYTCKTAPTAKITMGDATYYSQTIKTLDVTNVDKATVSDLFLTVTDSYGRYVTYQENNGVWEADTITAATLDDLPEKARFTLFDCDGTTHTQYAWHGTSGTAKAEKYDEYKNGEGSKSWKNITLPSFANSTYKITLYMSYNTGDRKGNTTVSGSGNYVNDPLASRDMCRTTSLNSLGSIGFTRTAGAYTADSVDYTYTSGAVASEIAAVLYRYDYDFSLLGTDENGKETESDVFKLRVSKRYNEITDADAAQGVLLMLPKKNVWAAEWQFNYTYSYRDKSDLSTHTVSGKVYIDDNKIIRTIFVDGDGYDQSGVERKVEYTFASEQERIRQFAYAIDFSTPEKALGITTVTSSGDGGTVDDAGTGGEQDAAAESSYTMTSAAQLSLVFAGESNYQISLPAANLCKAMQSLGTASDTEKKDLSFENALLTALSTNRAPLKFSVSGIQSAKNYRAKAEAFAYQQRATTQVTNTSAGTEGEGDVTTVTYQPAIVSLTTSTTTLSLATKKQAPYVNMYLFSTSNSITLYDFYVLDHGAILEKTAGAGRYIDVKLYEVTGKGTDGETEVLIDQYREKDLEAIEIGENETGDDKIDANKLDISFTGLSAGKTYRIKVTARIFDDSPKGNNKQYNYLIGEDSAANGGIGKNDDWVATGTWDTVAGASIESGITLEEVLAEDPYIMDNQLIDFSTAEDENTDWEIGTLSYVDGKMVGSGNTSYRTSNYIDLRTVSYDENTGEPVYKLNPSDIYLLRSDQTYVYYYDENKNYLGYVSYRGARSVSTKGTISPIWQMLVTMPNGYLSGTGAKGYDFKVSDIAYARVAFHVYYANQVYFGRLDAGYLTSGSVTASNPANGADVSEVINADTKGSAQTGNTEFATTSGWNDIVGTIRNASSNYNYWTYLSTDRVMTKNQQFTYSTADSPDGIGGTTVNINNYYTDLIPVTANDVFVYTGKASNTKVSRTIYFLNEKQEIIPNVNEDKKVWSYKNCYSDYLYVVPTNAKWMMVGYNYTWDVARTDASYSLYIMKGTDNTGVAYSYRSWLQSMNFEETTDNSDVTINKIRTVGEPTYVMRNRYLNNNTNLKYVPAGNTTAEVTAAIPVNPGDLYLMQTDSRTMYFYDKNDKCLYGIGGQSTQEYQYVLIPEGVAYIRVENWRSTNACDDRSILAANYNSKGCLQIFMLYCGNLSDLYKTHMGSTSQLYANMRVTLSDKKSNLTSAGNDGSYYLNVYEVACEDNADVLESAFLATTPEKKAEGTIKRIRVNGVDQSEAISTCVTLPVKKGYAYKVELIAALSGSSGEVSLGSAYFDVGSKAEAVYGIASDAQMYGIQYQNSGSYILNHDITLRDDRLPGNCGTFYGTLDLQGHTLTNASETRSIFYHLGSYYIPTAVVKNGTIRADVVRNKARSGYYLLCYNYGLIQDIDFKINISDPTMESGEESRSLWPSNTNAVAMDTNQSKGIIRNFTVEYEDDLVACGSAGFMYSNYGLIENGYIYSKNGQSVYGGDYATGLVRINYSGGTVRYIYSTVDVKGNTTPRNDSDLKSIYTISYAGTIVARNIGKAYGLLSTGNVFDYSIRTNSAYVFQEGDYYTNYGCAVGRSEGKKETTDCYYAVVGTAKRQTYMDAYNKRVESALLKDASWYKDVFAVGTAAWTLDGNTLSSMLKDGYYPWIKRGAGAEKYSMRQEYLTLDTASSAGFELLKTELVEKKFDSEGFETAVVKFVFSNPAEYKIASITVQDLSVSNLTVTATGNEADGNGFYELTAELKVADKTLGSYTDKYLLQTIRYQREEGGPYYSLRYGTTSSRYVEVPFYYPLNNIKDWDEIFVKDHAYWNFRIWGEDDDANWDFLKLVYDEDSTKGYYVSPVRTFVYYGTLDGTYYTYDKEQDKYVVATEADGSVKCHVIKNAFDYLIYYDSNNNIRTNNPYSYSKGYLIYQLYGSIQNLTVEDMTVGVERYEHYQAVTDAGITVNKINALQKDTEGNALTIAGNPVSDHDLRRLYCDGNNSGVIGYMGDNSSMSNVHVNQALFAQYRNWDQYIGSLAGYSGSYITFSECGATDVSIVTSQDTRTVAAGGLIGYAWNYTDMSNCYATDISISIVASSNTAFSSYGVGGLIGYSRSNVTIESCYAGGTIETAGQNVGGIVGCAQYDTNAISKSYSDVDIVTTSTNVGGILGRNDNVVSIANCLYTGTISASSKANTIHLILGYNVKTASLSECYAYQPSLDDDDTMIDAGVMRKDYASLTTSEGAADFYRNLLGSSFVTSWSATDHTGTYSIADGYLPALYGSEGTSDGAATGRILQQGQASAGKCHVPTIVAETTKIDVVRGYASENIASEKIQASMTRDGLWTFWNKGQLGADIYNAAHSDHDHAIVYADSNDISIKLMLGSGSSLSITSLEIDGFEEGGIYGATQNFHDGTFDEQGGFVEGTKTNILDASAVKVSCANFSVSGMENAENTDTNVYLLTLQGARLTTWRDSYTLKITLSNGTVLRQNFQFYNADGELDGRYLTIGSAKEWNEKMAIYGTLQQNIEITGNIDFSEITGQYGNLASIQMNVIVNNIRSTINPNTKDYYVISNLSVPYASDAEGEQTKLNTNSLKRETYGLIKSVNGNMEHLRFSDIELWWKSENWSALDNSGLVGRVSGNVTDCNFTRITLNGGGSYFGCIGRCDGTIDTAELVDIYVEADGNYVGGLVGYLVGDLLNVTAYGTEKDSYYVIGSNDIGGIAGAIFATDHTENGHQIIGGTDYVKELSDPEIAVSQRTPENTGGSTEGWYYKEMVSAGKLYADSNNYRYDSLSYNYVLVENISVDTVTVTAYNSYSGGVAGAEWAMSSSTNGYGYLLADGIYIGKNGKVYVSCNARKAANDGYAGGAFGEIRAYMIHDIQVDGVDVEARGSNYAGGFTGAAWVDYNETYSPYANDEQTARIGNFLSAAADVTVKNAVVRGGTYTGGFIGRNYRQTNMYKINVSDSIVLGAGNYIGGAYGNSCNWDIDSRYSNLSVYNSASEGKYTGGVAGSYDGAGRRHILAHDLFVVASGADDAASYTGGVAGWMAQWIDLGDDTEETAADTATDWTEYYENHSGRSIVYNLSVYGHSYVGGISGQGSNMKYVTINPADENTIYVSGTGDYVGGLFGYSGGTTSYVTGQNFTVKGRGIMIGGLGGWQGFNIYNSTFSDINVTGNGDGGSTEVKILNESAAMRYTHGTMVGGVGGYAGGVILYTSISDVKVTAIGEKSTDISGLGAGGSCVGGIWGATYTPYMDRCNIQNVTVKSDNAKNIGGIAGYQRMNTWNSSYSNEISDVAIEAISSSNVGGWAGSVEVKDTANGYSISYNTLDVEINIGTDTGNTQQNIGGFIGATYNLAGVTYNQVEAVIEAPNAVNVGGLIGYNNKQSDYNYYNWYQKNIVVSRITAKDKISGMIGYSEVPILGRTYNPGRTGIGDYTYYDVIATQITATSPNATASFFYSYSDGSQIVKDRDARTEAHTNNRVYNYYYTDHEAVNKYSVTNDPYGMRLWADSYYTVGNTTTKATEAVFESSWSDGQKAKGSEANGSKAIYWRGSEKYSENVDSYITDGLLKATKASNISYQEEVYRRLALVTTEDLKNPKFYVNVTGTTGNQYNSIDSLGLSTYSGWDASTGECLIEGNKITVPGLVSNQTDGITYNIYGLFDDVTSGQNTYYLPSTVPPHMLIKSKAQDIKMTDMYVAYRMGTGTLVDDEHITLTLDYGICVPGTSGSIVQEIGEESGTIGAINPLEDIEIQTTPRVYASNAYTLNVDFTSKDKFAGTQIQVYTATKDSSGQTQEASAPMLTRNTTEGQLSYSMYYDFQTELDIKIVVPQPAADGSEAGSENGGEENEDVVLYEIHVDPDTYRTRIANYDTYMYCIGKDGQVYKYKTSYSTELDSLAEIDGLGNTQVINIMSDGSSSGVAVLTKDRQILYIKGIGYDPTKKGMYVPVGVGTELSNSQTGTETENPVDGSQNGGGTQEGAQEASATGTEQATAIRAAGQAANAAALHTASKQPSMWVLRAATSDTMKEIAAKIQVLAAQLSEAGQELLTGDTEAVDDDTALITELTEDDISNTDEISSFDDSLLNAEPLYEFDYKGRHIATYLTYSLIFDGDTVTVRNMQLFVKNDRLFAINAPDDIVPGSIVIDSYQGSNYMSVLTKNGQIVDLMDSLNYPEGFVNRNIKNMSSNLESDLAYVQVEYEDGSIVAFNYLTGTVIYEEGASEDTSEGLGSFSEFVAYIVSFFREKFDTAYSEVSNAYQNAIDLKDYLMGSGWSSWLGADSLSDADETDAEDKILYDSSSSADGERTGSGVKGAYGELNEDALMAADLDDDADADGAGSAAVPAGGTNEPQSGEDAVVGSLPGDEGSGNAVGAAAGVLEEETTAGALAGEGAEGADGVGAAVVQSGEDSADRTESGTDDGQTDAEKTGDASEDAEANENLIIAYDGANSSYAIYSEEELLGGEESVTSVDQRMEDYLSEGGTIATYQGEIPSLSVTGSQKKGIYIIFITGTAIGGMLIILIVQKTKRRSRKSIKFRRK